jgi:hypothetical protein
MNQTLNTNGQLERTQSSEPIDMFEYVSGLGLRGDCRSYASDVTGPLSLRFSRSSNRARWPADIASLSIR